MKRILLSLALLALSACATTPQPSRYADGNNTVYISGEIKQGIRGPGGLKIGLIADSQLQTRSNTRHVRGYRNKFADAAVNVAIRPADRQRTSGRLPHDGPLTAPGWLKLRDAC